MRMVVLYPQDDLKRFVNVSQRYKDAVARLEAEAQAQAAKAADDEKQAAEVTGVHTCQPTIALQVTQRCILKCAGVLALPLHVVHSMRQVLYYSTHLAAIYYLLKSWHDIAQTLYWSVCSCYASTTSELIVLHATPGLIVLHTALCAPACRPPQLPLHPQAGLGHALQGG
jgi:hypothetical protein